MRLNSGQGFTPIGPEVTENPTPVISEASYFPRHSQSVVLNHSRLKAKDWSERIYRASLESIEFVLRTKTKKEHLEPPVPAASNPSTIIRIVFLLGI